MNEKQELRKLRSTGALSSRGWQAAFAQLAPASLQQPGGVLAGGCRRACGLQNQFARLLTGPSWEAGIRSGKTNPHRAQCGLMTLQGQRKQSGQSLSTAGQDKFTRVVPEETVCHLRALAGFRESEGLFRRLLRTLSCQSH